MTSGEKRTFIELNHTDYFWLIMEDVMPSMSLFMTLTFKTRHSSEEIYRALRRLLTVYPRLRHLVEPTLLTYHLSLLPDDEDIDRRFQGLFESRPGLDAASREYEYIRRELLNRPFDLEKELPLRALFLPDSSRQVLILSVHRITCDGKSWVPLVDTFMQILNGADPGVKPLDDRYLFPVLLKKPAWKIPAQIIKSFGVFHRNSRERRADIPIVHPLKSHARTFGHCDMHDQVLEYDLPALQKAAAKLDCSTSQLLMAAMALALMRAVPGTRGETAQIFFIINLRPFYTGRQPELGNYLLSGLVRAARELGERPAELVREIKRQWDENYRQVREGEILWSVFLNSLLFAAGRRLSGHIARSYKKRGAVPFTYLFSDFGETDRFNTHGNKALLGEACATVPHDGIFLSVSSMDSRLRLTLSWPLEELSRDDIKKLVAEFNKALPILAGA